MDCNALSLESFHIVECMYLSATEHPPDEIFGQSFGFKASRVTAAPSSVPWSITEIVISQQSSA